MKQTISLLTALLLSACAASTTPTVTPQSAPPAPSASAPYAETSVEKPGRSYEFDRANLDTTVSACTDFYQYANGGWLATHPIPAQYSTWGMLSQLNEDNRQTLREILEAAAAKPAAQRSANEQKIGDFYSSCMNEKAIDAAGLAPLQSDLDAIAAISSPRDLQRVFARLQEVGVDAPFGIGAQQDSKDSSRTIAAIGQDGLGLPDRDYYFRTDEKSQKVRAEYVAHMKKMFALAGLSGDADAVMRLETALAAASRTAVQLRDPQTQYNPTPVAQLSTLAPSIDWPLYFTQRGLPELASANVLQPEYFKAVSALMTSTPIADWQAYLRWQLLNATGSALPTAIADESFHFHGEILQGQKQQQARWQRCVVRTDAAIGEALGQAYVDRTFPPEAKRRTTELVDNLAKALHDNIGKLDWMSETTRQNADAKLAAFRRKLGYPDHWRDYSSLTISNGPLATNVLAANAFERTRDLAKVGHPPDLGEWGMTPPTINAYYDSSFNEIVFPAGILQWPMYDIHQDDAFNYGAAGSVIGHEMTHGFDDEGSQFDAKGNMVNWWTPEDQKRFAARAECIVQEFNGYSIEPGTSHNGKLVAGEAIADLGGLVIAYEAWQKSLEGKPAPQVVDGFTPEQRFFLGFARARASNQTIESMRQRILTNPHPINKFRVNGPVSDVPAFAKAFGCKAGDPMVRANACQIW